MATRVMRTVMFAPVLERWPTSLGIFSSYFLLFFYRQACCKNQTSLFTLFVRTYLSSGICHRSVSSSERKKLNKYISQSRCISYLLSRLFLGKINIFISNFNNNIVILQG